MIDLGAYRARCRAVDRHAVRCRFLALNMRDDDDVTWVLTITDGMPLGQRKAWLAVICGITRERVYGRWDWVVHRAPLTREQTADYLDCDIGAVKSLVDRAAVKLAARLAEEAA